MRSLASSLADPKTGIPLPSTLRTQMESLLGADFAAVRLHVSPWPAAFGARAFAYADEIHFAPDEYQPESAEGWRVLGHELAHVVQQRQGRVMVPGVPAANVSRVQHPRLEQEAAQAGDLAAALFYDRLPQQPLRPASGSGLVAAATYAVQCLMSVEEFKKATHVTLGTRDKISVIDNDLKAVNDIDVPAAGPETLRPYPLIRTRMEKLAQSCDTFQAAHPKSDRVPGVDKLRTELRLELSVITPLAGLCEEKDDLKQWPFIEAAQEALLVASRSPTGWTRKLGAGEVNLALKLQQIRMGELDSLVASNYDRDFQSLRAVEHDASAPPIIKQIIRETTATVNMSQVTWALPLMGPSCTYSKIKTKVGPSKYVLAHAMTQINGKSIRLGSMLHELTHLSIAESFDNTVIMLACPRGCTDQDWINLCTKRHAGILSLQRKIKASTLSDWQIQELMEKSEYAIGGKFKSYLTILLNWKNRTIIDPSGNKVPAGKSKDKYDRLLALFNAGSIKSELVEYDTVINQMLVWCFLWHVPQTDSVFVELARQAKEAYDYRAHGRATLNAVPLPPPVVVPPPAVRQTTPWIRAVY